MGLSPRGLSCCPTWSLLSFSCLPGQAQHNQKEDLRSSSWTLFLHECGSPKVICSVSFLAPRRLAWRNTIGSWYTIIFYSFGHLDIFQQLKLKTILLGPQNAQFPVLQTSSLLMPPYSVPTNISVVSQSCHFHLQEHSEVAFV